MSVTLTKAPDLHAFSGDFINAEFTCTSYLDQVGVKASCTLDFNPSHFPGNGVYFTLNYGNKSLLFTAVNGADDSGTQFESGQTSVDDVVARLNANPQISADFLVTKFATWSVKFEAKKTGADYNLILGLKTAVMSITAYNVGAIEIVKPNYTVLFNLYLENVARTGFDLIYSTNLQLRYGTAKAIAQINDKLNQKLAVDIDLFGLEIPTTSVLNCTKSARRYYIEYAESYGEVITVKTLTKSTNFNVIHGKSSFQSGNNTLVSKIAPSTAINDRFLKQSSNIQQSRVGQPQYLYFYNTRTAQNGAKLAVKRVFTDASTDTVTNQTFNLDQYGKYAFNVNYENIYVGVKNLASYEVYLTDNSGNRISEKQIYSVIRDRKRYIRYFLNWSSWGSFDSRCFTGMQESSFDITYQKANRILQAGYNISQGEAKVYGKSAVSKFSAATGFNDRAFINFNKDFLLSTLQFRYFNNSLLPIEVTSSSVSNPPDGEFKYAQTFEYQYLFADQAFSETDEFDEFGYPHTIDNTVPPDAPTNGIVNDVNKTFTFTPNTI